MRAGWERGSFGYFLAVHSPKGMLRVFNEHVQRQFCEEHCTQRVLITRIFLIGLLGPRTLFRRRLRLMRGIRIVLRSGLEDMI
jgi:hypothetical protein